MEIAMSLLKAFFVGGTLCAIGQIFIDFTKLTPARILVGYVVSGVILSAVGLYAPLVEFGGAGATVVLLGFGNVLASGVKGAVVQYGLLGALSGGLAAGSAGIAASILFAFIGALIFKPQDK